MHSSTLLIAVTLPLLIAGCGDSTGPIPGPPAELNIISGNEQQGTVGQELPEPLVVRVEDEAGRPIAGQLVNFRVVSGGGSVFAGASLTNREGLARERWTLGTVAGDTQRVEARAVDNETGEPLLFGTFKAVGKAAAPATIAAAEGMNQSGPAGAALPDSMAVALSDEHGNPVPGVQVSWTVETGGGSITPASTSNAQGIARAEWILGPRLDANPQQARAALGSLAPVGFSATAQLPGSATLSKVAGDGQTGSPGALLPDSLVVSVQLSDGRPVVGAVVTWAILEGGGALSAESTTTGPLGQARVAWKLGFGDSHRVRASLDGTGSVEFAASSSATTLQDIAISHRIGQTSSVIKILRPDGTLVRTFSDAFHPSWSPEGSQIAYVPFVSKDEIRIVNADGTGTSRTLVGPSGGEVFFSPDWSPVGAKIAYVRLNAGVIHIVNTDGSGDRQLTSGRNPSWNPNGSRLVFDRCADAQCTTSQIYSVNEDGSGEILLGDGFAPAWSPNGSKIVFSRSVGGTADLFVMDADGTNVRQLNTGLNATDPAWSGDGNWVVFASTAPGDIHIIGADGSGRTLVFSGGTYGAGSPDWRW